MKSQSIDEMQMTSRPATSAGLIHEGPEPQLEHQQHEQVMRVIVALVLMIVEDAAHLDGLEESARVEAIAENVIGEKILQLAAEPAGDWHRKALLGPVHIV